MTLLEQRDSLRNYYESVVPQALIDAGLEEIPAGNFLTNLPNDIDTLSFTVSIAEGMKNAVVADNAFVIQVWLPNVTFADEYTSALWEIIRKTEPSIVEADDRACTYQSWDAADGMNMSNTSNCVFEIAFSNALDDCEE